MVKQKLLKKLDEIIFSFLKKNVEFMPNRAVKYIAYNYTDARVRKLYLRRLGVVMGAGTYTNLGFRIVSDDFLPRVFIGNNVSIAPNVTFIVMSSANNGIKINKIPYVKEKLTKQGNIVIENDVWIGANVTVLPGIHIGECVVIGAGSVVTKDIESFTVVAGNPARILRKLYE